MNQQNPDKKSVSKPVINLMLENWVRNGHVSSFKVIGGSMHPSLLPGDVIYVQHSNQHFRPGDLLAFQQEGILVVHRLLRVYSNNGCQTYKTKGDNCPQPDPLVSQDQVVGIVRSIQRGNREFHLDTPLSCGVAGLISLSSRVGLFLDDLGSRVKRSMLGTSHNSITHSLRRSIAWLAAFPMRVFNRLLWRKP